MTHPTSLVTRALELHSRGLTAAQISEVSDVPRRTVGDWISGRRPRVPAGRRCPRCGGGEHAPGSVPAEYAYLLGLYLGDGYIATHRRDVLKLRITLDAAYPIIIDEAAHAMSMVMPTSRVGRYTRPYGDVEVYAYSKSWACLFPQHGSGPKHRRTIALAAWQDRIVRAVPESLLRGLIHSDGCRFLNTGRGWEHPRYAFRNRSSGIRRVFRDACERLDLHTTCSGDVVYVSKMADVARMDTFIGPKR